MFIGAGVRFRRILKQKPADEKETIKHLKNGDDHNSANYTIEIHQCFFYHEKRAGLQSSITKILLMPGIWHFGAWLCIKSITSFL
jgi:hypothetical protein